MTDQQSRRQRLQELMRMATLQSDMSLYGIDRHYPLIIPDDSHGELYHTPEMMMTLNRLMLGDQRRDQGPIVIGAGWHGRQERSVDTPLCHNFLLDDHIIRQNTEEKKVAGSPLLLKLVSRI